MVVLDPGRCSAVQWWSYPLSPERVTSKVTRSADSLKSEGLGPRRHLQWHIRRNATRKPARASAESDPPDEAEAEAEGEGEARWRNSDHASSESESESESDMLPAVCLLLTWSAVCSADREGNSTMSLSLEQ